MLVATHGIVVLSLILGTEPAPDRDSPEAEQFKVDPVLDGAITGGAFLGSALLPLLNVDTSTRWRTQLLPWDDDLKGRHSTRDAQVSDYLIGAQTTIPFALLGSQGLNTDSLKYALVYVETISVSTLLNGIVKYSVARPRPYVYSLDPATQRYAIDEGKDSHLSFYSGHSSLAFAASVSSAMLFAQRSQNNVARTAVWATGLALASATATLRTTAGKHFYSDVLVGATVGSTFGWGIPRVHGAKIKLSASEWVAIVVAPILGVVVASLVAETQHPNAPTLP
jgi:membrane-associated phospholipid phosphatase